MAMPTRSYSDEQLSAWVDGEGSAGERAEIEAWLRDHPDEAARVQAWSADREALCSAYADVVREPVPQRLASVVWQQGVAAGAAAPPPMTPAWRRWPGWSLAAAAGLLFVLGGAAGGLLTWQWQERQLLAQRRAAPQALAGAAAASNWLQRAAFAHSVYTPEPRHAVEVRAQEEHLARWLTRRIEAPVKLFDLKSLGFELVGGRLLPDGAGKSAQLMYQDANGKRVTVYLRKPEPGTDAAFRYEQQGTLGMFYWVEEKTGFALVGDVPKEQLLALARSIYNQDATLPAPSLTPPVAASGAATATGPQAPSSSASATGR